MPVSGCISPGLDTLTALGLDTLAALAWTPLQHGWGVSTTHWLREPQVSPAPTPTCPSSCS